MSRSLVAEKGFVALVANVTNEIGPGNAVGGSYEIGMGDGAERLADVGGVGYVAVGGEENGAETGGVGGVAEVGVCCLGCAEGRGGGLVESEGRKNVGVWRGEREGERAKRGKGQETYVPS